MPSISNLRGKRYVIAKTIEILDIVPSKANLNESAPEKAKEKEGSEKYDIYCKHFGGKVARFPSLESLEYEKIDNLLSIFKTSVNDQGGISQSIEFLRENGVPEGDKYSIRGECDEFPDEFKTTFDPLYLQDPYYFFERDLEDEVIESYLSDQDKADFESLLKDIRCSFYAKPKDELIRKALLLALFSITDEYYVRLFSTLKTIINEARCLNFKWDGKSSGFRSEETRKEFYKELEKQLNSLDKRILEREGSLTCCLPYKPLRNALAHQIRNVTLSNDCVEYPIKTSKESVDKNNLVMREDLFKLEKPYFETVKVNLEKVFAKIGEESQKSYSFVRFICGILKDYDEKLNDSLTEEEKDSIQMNIDFYFE